MSGSCSARTVCRSLGVYRLGPAGDQVADRRFVSHLDRYVLFPFFFFFFFFFLSVRPFGFRALFFLGLTRGRNRRWRTARASSPSFRMPRSSCHPSQSARFCFLYCLQRCRPFHGSKLIASSRILWRPQGSAVPNANTVAGVIRYDVATEADPPTARCTRRAAHGHTIPCDRRRAVPVKIV